MGVSHDYREFLSRVCCVRMKHFHYDMRFHTREISCQNEAWTKVSVVSGIIALFCKKMSCGNALEMV